MNIDIINNLEKDCEVLKSKMNKALSDDNIGTYNNLQKALVNNVNAIETIKKCNFKESYNKMITEIFNAVPNGSLLHIEPRDGNFYVEMGVDLSSDRSDTKNSVLSGIIIDWEIKIK